LKKRSLKQVKGVTPIFKKTKNRCDPTALLTFKEKLRELKTPVSTSLGAINFILLGGRGELGEEQKRFLNVAKKNLESLFARIQDFNDWIESETKTRKGK